MRVKATIDPNKVDIQVVHFEDVVEIMVFEQATHGNTPSVQNNILLYRAQKDGHIFQKNVLQSNLDLKTIEDRISKTLEEDHRIKGYKAKAKTAQRTKTYTTRASSKPIVQKSKPASKTAVLMSALTALSVPAIIGSWLSWPLFTMLVLNQFWTAQSATIIITKAMLMIRFNKSDLSTRKKFEIVILASAIITLMLATIGVYLSWSLITMMALRSLLMAERVVITTMDATLTNQTKAETAMLIGIIITLALIAIGSWLSWPPITIQVLNDLFILETIMLFIAPIIRRIHIPSIQSTISSYLKSTQSSTIKHNLFGMGRAHFANDISTENNLNNSTPEI